MALLDLQLLLSRLRSWPRKVRMMRFRRLSRTSKKTKNKTVAESPEVLAAKETAKADAALAKKSLDTKLAKTKALKIRSDAAQSAFSELVLASTSQPEWSWCTNHHLRDPEAAKKALDNFKSGSPFWAAWAVQAGFATYAKKSLSADILEAALSRTMDVEKLVATLEKTVNKLTKMHVAGLL